MAAISASLVKELRERTGLGMMECKKALTEADGDIETAIENLRKNSGLKAAKKAERTAAEGGVVTRVAEDGTYGVMRPWIKRRRESKRRGRFSRRCANLS